MEPDEPVRIDVDQMLPSDLLSPGEQVIIAIKPSLWIIAFLSFRTIVAALAVMIAAMLLARPMRLEIYSGKIIIFCGLAILARVLFALLQWAGRSYVLTDQRVIRVRGVFTVDIFQCATSRLQNTFMILTLPQRVLRIGSIGFATAGTSQIEAVWHHIKTPLKIHNKLVRTINPTANKPGQNEIPVNNNGITGQ